MPDLADDHAAYREAMARAEAASGIERDAEGNETNGIEAFMRGETPDVNTELEGAVPVQASDQPLAPEPVVEPTPDTSGQQQEAPAAQPTAEELARQLAAAEARVEEQKLMIGRQSSEVGETREQMAALKAQLDAIQAQQAQPVTPVIAITQDLIDNNPARAVQAAFDQRDEEALDIAFEAWKEIDPFTSAAWLGDRRLEQQKREFDTRLAEQQQRLDAVTAPLAARSAEAEEQQQWAQAFDEVKATRPDFLAVVPETGKTNAERLLTEVAPQYPSIANVLMTGGAQEKAQALSALYALDKLGNPQAVQAQLETAAQEAEAEAAAARATAGIVTSQSTAGQPAEQKTDEELEQEAYVVRMGRKPSLARGWTGRT